MDLASLIIGWGLFVSFILIGIRVALSRIAVFNADGFRTLNRRKPMRWTDVLWADVELETYGILPNWVVAVTCEEKASDGQHLQIALEGLAGFRGSRRISELSAKMNNWIEAANPGRVINPWLWSPHANDEQGEVDKPRDPGPDYKAAAREAGLD